MIISMNRSRKILLLKFTVAIAALLYVVHLVDWNNSINILKRADPAWLFSGFLCSLICFYPAAIRWVILLRAAKKQYSVYSAYRSYLTGTFFGLVMPGVVGGDATRIWLCRRSTDASITLISATVLLERVLGVVALLIFLSIGVNFFPHAKRELGAGIVPILTLIGLCSIFALPYLLNKYINNHSSEPHYTNNRFSNFASKISKELEHLKGISISHLFFALLFSGIFQLFDIAATYSIAQALEIDLSASMLLVAMPIVYLATVLPISPGGLGVREGTLVLVLALFGVSSSNAAILALAVFANRAAVGFLGGLQYLIIDKRAVNI